MPDTLRESALDEIISTFRVRIVRIRAEDLSRLRRLQNTVATVLMAIALRSAFDRVANLVQLVQQMIVAGFAPDDIRRFLPLAEKLIGPATTRPPSAPTSAETLPSMRSVLGDLIDEAVSEALSEGLAKGRAEGEARGKALGEIAAIRDLLA